MNYRMIRSGALALVAVATLPALASAQSRETFELPAIQVEAFQNPLHMAALALYETPSRWAEAGELHEQAAKELARNDAGQFFGYNRAAALFRHQTRRLWRRCLVFSCRSHKRFTKTH